MYQITGNSIDLLGVDNMGFVYLIKLIASQNLHPMAQGLIGKYHFIFHVYFGIVRIRGNRINIVHHDLDMLMAGFHIDFGQFIQDVPAMELVKVFSDGLSAMEFLNEETVDLMFLDIHLPKINGLDFLKSIPDPPQVILTTAFPWQEHPE